MRHFLLRSLVALTAALAAACGGGGGGGPTAPTGGGTGGGGTGGGGGATITIGANGQVSPTTLTVSVGTRITFVNNHNQPHDMNSDPHPAHTDCPPLAQVGFLLAGQSKTSGNLNTARRCGFHDHNDETNTALQGVIIVQ